MKLEEIRSQLEKERNRMAEIEAEMEKLQAQYDEHDELVCQLEEEEETIAEETRNQRLSVVWDQVSDMRGWIYKPAQKPKQKKKIWRFDVEKDGIKLSSYAEACTGWYSERYISITTKLEDTKEHHTYFYRNQNIKPSQYDFKLDDDTALEVAKLSIWESLGKWACQEKLLPAPIGTPRDEREIKTMQRQKKAYKARCEKDSRRAAPYFAFLLCEKTLKAKSALLRANLRAQLTREHKRELLELELRLKNYKPKKVRGQQDYEFEIDCGHLKFEGTYYRNSWRGQVAWEVNTDGGKTILEMRSGFDYGNTNNPTLAMARIYKEALNNHFKRFGIS